MASRVETENSFELQQNFCLLGMYQKEERYGLAWFNTSTVNLLRVSEGIRCHAFV